MPNKIESAALGPHYDKCPQCQGSHTLDRCPNWRAIATAPRDGRNILIRFGQDGVSQAKSLVRISVLRYPGCAHSRVGGRGAVSASAG